MPKMRLCRSLFFGLFIFASAPSAAQNEAEEASEEGAEAADQLRPPVFEGWTGTASLGANASTGRVETSNINVSVRVGKRARKVENWVSASAFKGRSALVAERRGADGMVVLDENDEPVVDIVRGPTSDRLAFAWQPRYYFRKGTYGFLTFDWEEDRPLGVEAAARILVGVGHTFHRDETGYFSVEVALGDKALENPAGENFNGQIYFAAANYLYRINPNVTFTANVSADHGNYNTALDAAVSIGFKLTETLAFGISHYVRSNSDITNEFNPLAGRRDSVTTMNLVIDI